MTLLRPPAAEVHVWYASVPALAPHVPTLQSFLSASERAGVTKDPLRRVVGRGVLRMLLGAYLALPPRDVPIVQVCSECGGPHGRLDIAELAVSLSYVPGVVAMAFAQAPVGIDVEFIRPDLSWPRIASLALPARTVAAIEQLPAASQRSAFFAAWTKREALAKAVGVGLAVTPDELDHRARSLASHWTIDDLVAPPGHRASIAVAQDGLAIRQCGWVTLDADGQRLAAGVSPSTASTARRRG